MTDKRPENLDRHPSAIEAVTIPSRPLPPDEVTIPNRPLPDFRGEEFDGEVKPGLSAPDPEDI